jgi:hypothetical protein
MKRAAQAFVAVMAAVTAGAGAQQATFNAKVMTPETALAAARGALA